MSQPSHPPGFEDPAERRGSPPESGSRDLATSDPGLATLVPPDPSSPTRVVKDLSSGSGQPASGWPLGDSRRFEPVRLLGSGGMGRVYEALDRTLHRRVAVKVLTADSPELAERFLREAQAQAHVDHPGICNVFEVGEVANHPYIVMQLIEGSSLQAMSDQLSLEQQVVVLREVAEAVHAAHRTGLVHRDIKPSNIMVERTEDGALRPVVVDFGLARVAEMPGVTVTGLALGTPGYMSPEQASGCPSAVDRRADIWSLGATLYSLLSGAPPHAGSSPVETLLKVLQEDAPPLRRRVPTVPRDLETIVMRCLERDPDRRYPTARALAEDLQHFLDGEPVTARPVGAAGRWMRRARRHPVLSGLATAAALTIVSLSLMWLHTSRTAARQSELAQRFGQQVEAAEALLWKAESIEPHDVREVRKQVRAQLAELSREMERAGRLATGPGHAALGRGFATLGEHDLAREHLERAWKAGFRSPDTALALGLTLSALHTEAVREALRLPLTERVARREEVDRTLRAPARDYLRLAAGSAHADSDLIHAHVALLERQYEQARALAAGAFARSPWLWEATWVEATALQAQAEALVATGNWQAYEAAYGDADQALQRGLRVGRSSPRLHTTRCELQGQLASTLTLTAGRVDPAPAVAAIAICEAALAVQPDNPQLMLQIALGQRCLGEQALGRGDDPTTYLEAAISRAQTVLALHPDMPDALSSLALAFWQLAKHRINSGGDGDNSLDVASTTARKAVEARPGNPATLQTLGLILLDVAVMDLAAGRDPTATVEESTRALRQAWERWPRSSSPGINIALALSVLLQHQVARDDPKAPATADEALRALERAREINAALFWIPRTEGTIQSQLAIWAANHGEDPIPRFEAAIAAFDEAFTLNPNDLATLIYLSSTCITAATYARATHLPSSTWIERAEHAINRGLALNPRSPHLQNARAHLPALRQPG